VIAAVVRRASLRTKKAHGLIPLPSSGSTPELPHVAKAAIEFLRLLGTSKQNCPKKRSSTDSHHTLGMAPGAQGHSAKIAGRNSAQFKSTITNAA
jgi:hypothetical protein